MSGAGFDEQRCIKNERTLDLINLKINDMNDKIIKMDLTLNRVIMNELKHKAEIEDVAFKRNSKDTAVLIAIITATSTIVAAIMYNLDTIISFLRGVI